MCDELNEIMHFFFSFFMLIYFYSVSVSLFPVSLFLLLVFLFFVFVLFFVVLLFKFCVCCCQYSSFSTDFSLFVCYLSSISPILFLSVMFY